MPHVLDWLQDSQGRPLKWILRFTERTTAYPFADYDEATAYAETFRDDFTTPPTVVAYTPPTMKEAERRDHQLREASNFYSIPCRHTP